MVKIGITGGMGAGKSYVSALQRFYVKTLSKGGICVMVN